MLFVVFDEHAALVPEENEYEYADVGYQGLLQEEFVLVFPMVVCFLLSILRLVARAHHDLVATFGVECVHVSSDPDGD